MRAPLELPPEIATAFSEAYAEGRRAAWGKSDKTVLDYADNPIACAAFIAGRNAVPAETALAAVRRTGYLPRGKQWSSPHGKEGEGQGREDHA